MQTFTQAQVAKKYNVSRATVNRWVDLAISGKYNLQLDHTNKVVRILDNAHNEVELAMLAEAAIKYKSGNLKQVEVSKEFYEIFDEEEIVEIINDLKFKKQIKHKFSYKKPQYWNNFYKLSRSPVTKAIDRLKENAKNNLLFTLENPELINLIDIGTGNGYPVKSMIKTFKSKGIMGRYVGVDISQGMLDIDRENLHKWFPDLDIVTHTKDCEVTRFGKIFLNNKTLLNKDSEKVSSNIILFLDGMCNLDDRIQVLKNIKSGMTEDDLFGVVFTLDTQYNRGQLNYIKDDEGLLRDGWHLKLLGIDIEKCQTFVEFDGLHTRKDKLYKLDKDYSIQINIFGKKETIHLYESDKISTWRHYLLTPETFISESKNAELEMVSYQTDQSFSYAFAICRIKV